MTRSFFIAAALLLGLQARADFKAQMPTQIEFQGLDQAMLSSVAQPMATHGLFTVGDSADYSMNMASFINGTAHMFVRNQVSQGFWVETDVDMGMMGKQKVEALYGNNGKLLQLLVNGQKQTPPDPSQEKIVDMHKATITVPSFKGQKTTFNCEYLKIHDNSQNTDTEVWVDRAVPVAGMVQQIAQSQFGPVTMQLTNDARGK